MRQTGGGDGRTRGVGGSMGKTKKAKAAIMSPDEERFMAFEGLVQWTQAVITESARVGNVLKALQNL
jgi:hypothetical protein